MRISQVIYNVVDILLDIVGESANPVEVERHIDDIASDIIEDRYPTLHPAIKKGIIKNVVKEYIAL